MITQYIRGFFGCMLSENIEPFPTLGSMAKLHVKVVKNPPESELGTSPSPYVSNKYLMI